MKKLVFVCLMAFMVSCSCKEKNSRVIVETVHSETTTNEVKETTSSRVFKGIEFEVVAKHMTTNDTPEYYLVMKPLTCDTNYTFQMEVSVDSYYKREVGDNTHYTVIRKDRFPDDLVECLEGSN